MGPIVLGGLRTGLLCLVSTCVVLSLASRAEAFWVEAFVAHTMINDSVDKATESADKLIDKIDARIKERIEQARQNGEDLIEKNGEVLRDRLKEAKGVLRGIINEAFKRVGEEREETFRQLAEERFAFFENVDRQQRIFWGEAHAFERRMSQDLERIARKIDVFRPERAETIRGILLTTVLSAPKMLWDGTELPSEILGQTQVFKARGTYDIQVWGRGFGAGNIGIRFDGRPVDFGFGAGHTRKYSLPVEALNTSFRDLKPCYAPIEFADRSEEGSELLKYSTVLELLPKFPVKYELFDSLPDGSTKRVYVTEFPGLYQRESALVDERQGVKPEDLPIEIAERCAEIAELTRQYLPFGTWFVDLSAHSECYELRIVWFNGDEAVLTPTSLSDQGISVATESATGRMRLRIDVRSPPKPRN